MERLRPKLEILPKGQRLLWERINSTPHDFVLYGGTALALRLGHRQSLDFDFFSCRSFQPLELARSMPYLEEQTLTQQAESTLSCNVDTEEGIVKISFFGGLSLGQVEPPDVIESNGIAIASLIDLFGMKCATIAQRNEVKDYLDIHALLRIADLELSMGIAAAKAIYGRQYDPLMTLQALSYFADLGEQLPETTKDELLAAVETVSLKNVPVLQAPKKIGAGIQHPRA